MKESTRRANTYERGPLDLVEAVLLQDRVEETFPAMVVSRSRKNLQEGQIMVKHPAVEASVESSKERPLPLGVDVEARLESADLAERRVRFRLG